MSDDTEINVDGADEEKKVIEKVLESHEEEILEPDEAANAAEGMTNREEDLSADVAEDRDQTPPQALDIPESEILS